MLVSFGSCRVDLVHGDITQQDTDAIVNAANSALAGGGGVDGAIHRAAGPEVMAQTRRQFPAGCATGSAVATGAGKMQARFIFHAVGPVWGGGRKDEPDLLRSAIDRCLELAVENDCRSIAFPAISTGVYRYPVDLAAETSLETVRDFLIEHDRPELTRFVLFSDGHYSAFARVLESMTE